MTEKCLCEQNDVLIFACAGSSNVGQIGNQTAIQLARDWASAGISAWPASGGMSRE